MIEHAIAIGCSKICVFYSCNFIYSKGLLASIDECLKHCFSFILQFYKHSEAELDRCFCRNFLRKKAL